MFPNPTGLSSNSISHESTYSVQTWKWTDLWWLRCLTFLVSILHSKMKISKSFMVDQKTENKSRKKKSFTTISRKTQIYSWTWLRETAEQLWNSKKSFIKLKDLNHCFRIIRGKGVDYILSDYNLIEYLLQFVWNPRYPKLHRLSFDGIWREKRRKETTLKNFLMTLFVIYCNLIITSVLWWWTNLLRIFWYMILGLINCNSLPCSPETVNSWFQNILEIILRAMLLQ